MANIKLSNLAKTFEDKTAKNPSDLSNFEKSVNTLYKDIKFDLTDINNSGIFTDNSINSNLSAKDIEVCINENEIYNSLKNWFRTSECSRLLNPDLKFDLRSYLFEGINEYTAYFLGLELMQKLPYFEPRINVEDCQIQLDYLNDAYIINMTLTIPSLNNKTINLKEILNSSGYTTL